MKYQDNATRAGRAVLEHAYYPKAILPRQLAILASVLLGCVLAYPIGLLVGAAVRG